MTGNGEGSLPSFPETTAKPSQERACPIWALANPDGRPTADFMGWFRVGGVNQALVTTYPVTPPPPAVNPPFVPGTGTERLNSQDLNQSFAAGPKMDLTYHGDDGYDVELSFFEIDGWNGAGIVLPNGQSPSFAAPGGFVQPPTRQPKRWDGSMRPDCTMPRLNAPSGPISRRYHDRRIPLGGGVGESSRNPHPSRPGEEEPFLDHHDRERSLRFPDRWRLENHRSRPVFALRAG